ncbi:MAG TPA: hypothetical protein VGM19_06735 [Armatimonadota bacterium]|jgi:hypothetical protein
MSQRTLRLVIILAAVAVAVLVVGSLAYSGGPVPVNLQANLDPHLVSIFGHITYVDAHYQPVFKGFIANLARSDSKPSVDLVGEGLNLQEASDTALTTGNTVEIRGRFYNKPPVLPDASWSAGGVLYIDRVVVFNQSW